MFEKLKVKSSKSILVCSNCKEPVKRFRAYRRFNAILCRICYKDYKRCNTMFDKIYSKFKDVINIKAGELFFQFLNNKIPYDFKIDIKVYYKDKEV